MLELLKEETPWGCSVEDSVAERSAMSQKKNNYTIIRGIEESQRRINLHYVQVREAGK